MVPRLLPALALTACMLAPATVVPSATAGPPLLTTAWVSVQPLSALWQLHTTRVRLTGKALAPVMAALRAVWRTPRMLTCHADVDAMARAGQATLLHESGPAPLPPGAPPGFGALPVRAFIATALPACHLVLQVNGPVGATLEPAWGFPDPHNTFYRAIVRAALHAALP